MCRVRLVLFFLASLSCLAHGQEKSNAALRGEFIDVNAILSDEVPQLSNGGVSWVDLKSTGAPDLFVFGIREGGSSRDSRIYINNGGDAGFDDNTTQVFSSPDLPGLGDGCAAWGDLNNDSLIDLAFIGSANNTQEGAFADIFFQQENALDELPQFYLETDPPFPFVPSTAFSNPSCVFVDVSDSPGLEFFLTATINPLYTNDPFSMLYLNQGNASTPKLVNVSDELFEPKLISVKNGAVAFADVMNDGTLWMMLTGEESGTDDIALYVQNSSTFVFHNEAGTRFDGKPPGLSFGTVSWVDYDGDGWLDLFLTGRRNDNLDPYVALYRHQPADHRFIDVTGDVFSGTDAPKAYQSAVQWVDINADGRVDLYISGKYGGDATESFSRLYFQNREGRLRDFTSEWFPSETLPPLYDGAVAFEDYNGDGLLDVFVMGTSQSGAPFSKLFMLNCTFNCQVNNATDNITASGGETVIISGALILSNESSVVLEVSGNGPFIVVQNGCASFGGQLVLNITGTEESELNLTVVEYSEQCDEFQSFNEIVVEDSSGRSCENAVVEEEQYGSNSLSVLIEVDDSGCGGNDDDVPLGPLLGGLGGAVAVCIVLCMAVVLAVCLVSTILLVGLIASGVAGMRHVETASAIHFDGSERL